MPLKVIIDTNFLFIPFQFNVDILRELERIANCKIEALLITPVIDELKSISEMGGIKGRQAEAALRYGEKLKRVDVEAKTYETVDDLILRLAAEWNCTVATNDRVLLKRLKNMNRSVIYLRKRSHLEIKGKI